MKERRTLLDRPQAIGRTSVGMYCQANLNDDVVGSCVNIKKGAPAVVLAVVVVLWL